MKKRNKEIIESLALMAMSLFLLVNGCFAKELGEEGVAIGMIMCSLYIAMWVHAGMVATLVNRKFEETR